jgi:hypothetical protein
VYVLGDHVSVHKRRSLPNLPQGRKSQTGFLEFDSQRPYPRLSDFEFDEAPLPVKEPRAFSPHDDPKFENVAMKRKRAIGTDSVPRSSVTADEIEPIVSALKGAFGLELFGFDVLITSSSSQSFDGAPRMLVVDVNYFPSYKDINFPGILAQYLTDKAIESRRMSHPSLSMG